MDNLYCLKSSKEIAFEIVDKVKRKRKALKITQEDMANRTGISLSTYRKFEKTGEISLSALIDIGFILNDIGTFSSLFETKEYKSIEEVIKLNA